MSLRVVVSSTAEGLIDDFLAAYWAAEGDVFAPTAVVVPNSATRNWITEQIATRSGSVGKANIASNIQFLYPSAITGQRLTTQAGADDSNVALAVRIYRVAKAHPGLVPNFENSKRPFRLAQRVARLFDRYVSYRPEMLAGWAKSTKPMLPSQHVWQWELWRKLALTPAELSTLGTEEIAQFAKPLLAFGFGEVSPTLVDAFAQLATQTDVVVYAIAPSPESSTPTNFALVQQWASPSFSSVQMLRDAANSFEVKPTANSTSLLAKLQSHIAADSAAGSVPRIDLENLDPAITDLSLQVHRCHGATRQVEVLRDAIFQMMARDPSLHPRDIVVVCPDLDRFAALIEPVLGADVGGKSLPVVIADRSITTRNALGLAFSDLLTVASGRVSSADVLSLLAHPMIRTRFGLDADGVNLITRWVNDLDVRWGLDTEHRGAHWASGNTITTGTWREALDRLLLGVLMQSSDLVEGLNNVVVYDDLGGTSIEIIGCLAALLKALDDLQQSLQSEHTLAEWHVILEHMLADFIHVGPEEQFQLDDAKESLSDLREIAPQAGDATFTANDIVDYVQDSIGNVRSRSAYWWHAIRVGTLVNFKSLPAKVMCLLGFDAESLTSAGYDGDDLLALAPQPGDPDARVSQRLHILNAIAAAKDSLIITCDGWDVKNNSKVPPAIAMEELLEAVGAVDPAAATGVISDHPRQLADARSFGGLSRLTDKFGGPFSASVPGLEVLQEIERNRGAATADSFDTHIYANPPSEHALTVDDLAMALNEPYRVLVEQRFDIRLPAETEAASEDIDLVIGRLHEHQLGDSMLRALESGVAVLDEWKQLRLKSGTLPPGKLGESVLGDVQSLVEAINAKGVHYRDGKQAEVKAFNNNIATPGVVVIGNAVVHGNRVITTTYAKQKRSRLIAPWFTVASLTLEYPDTEWEAVVLCSNDDRDGATEDRILIAGETPEQRIENARKILEFGVDMRRRSLQSVLPVGTDVSWLIGSGAAKTNVGKALTYACNYNEVYKLVRGVEDLWQLRREAPIKDFDDTIADGVLTADQLDGEGVGYRARRYAKWLFNVWSTTTLEPTAKVKRAKK